MVAAIASSAGTLATAAPVSAASVLVVETDSAREVPSSAWTSSGTSAVYRPTCTGRPAIVA